MSAPATTPAQCFPPGSSLALRPTRGRQGHLVSWLQRGQLPPARPLPPGMRGSWKPGAEPSTSENHCKTSTLLGWGRRSAGVGARLGWGQRPSVAVSMGPGGQRQGPAAGPGLRLWARALTVPCTGTHIWLAGAQRCPINAWPGPAPRPPASAHAEGCGVNTCCGRDEILLRGRWGPPGPGRMRGVSTDVWGGQRGREPLACPGATDGKLRPGRQLRRRPGQDPTPGLPGPSSVTLPSGLC